MEAVSIGASEHAQQPALVVRCSACLKVGSKTFYDFDVKLTAAAGFAGASVRIRRSASALRRLHACLRKRFPTVDLPFPPRAIVTARDQQAGKAGADAYLMELLHVPSICESDELQCFLEGGLDRRDRVDEEQESVAANSWRRCRGHGEDRQSFVEHLLMRAELDRSIGEGSSGSNYRWGKCINVPSDPHNHADTTFHEATLDAGAELVVPVALEARSALLWSFQTLDYDVGFGVRFEGDFGAGKQLRRVLSHMGPVEGILHLPSDASPIAACELVWSNAHSRLRHKRLRYRIATVDAELVNRQLTEAVDIATRASSAAAAAAAAEIDEESQARGSFVPLASDAAVTVLLLRWRWRWGAAITYPTERKSNGERDGPKDTITTASPEVVPSALLVRATSDALHAAHAAAEADISASQVSSMTRASLEVSLRACSAALLAQRTKHELAIRRIGALEGELQRTRGYMEQHATELRAAQSRLHAEQQAWRMQERQGAVDRAEYEQRLELLQAAQQLPRRLHTAHERIAELEDKVRVLRSERQVLKDALKRQRGNQ